MSDDETIAELRRLEALANEDADDGVDDEPQLDLFDRPRAKRKVNAIMRRAFDDLDADIYAEKRYRRHRRQRFVRTMRMLPGTVGPWHGYCASCGSKMSRDELESGKGARRARSVTCRGCLGVDSAYKKASVEVERKARYVDELGRPMVLKGTPRMLPIYGERYDGASLEWPKCENLSACMKELILACGAKDAPGMSCPKGCAHRIGASPVTESSAR